MTKIGQRVFSAWREGRADKGSDSFWTDGRNFYSYATCLFSWRYQALNVTRYSATTTKYQRALKQELAELVAEEVDDMPRGITHNDLSAAALESAVKEVGK